MELRRTALGNQIEIAADKAKYDAQVKKLLANKQILSRIMKRTVEEFKDLPVEEIMECIEGDPSIAAIPVYPGKLPENEMIAGQNTEDKVPNEGEITFDIRFTAVTPGKEQIKLLLNVEGQKDFRPGYDLTTRGIYYCARMLSAQMDTEFTSNDYDGIKKVYSIWICMDVPRGGANTITKYAMQQIKLYGDFSLSTRYDLLEVVMVCMGKNKEQKDKLIAMLQTLLSEELKTEDKFRILKDEYEIITETMEKEVRVMCNLSDLVEERGIEKGQSQNTIEMVEKCMTRNNCSAIEACDLMGCDYEEYTKAQAFLEEYDKKMAWRRERNEDSSAVEEIIAGN